MKKRIAAAAAAVLMLVMTACSAEQADTDYQEESATSAGVTINVYNWGEYISNGVDGTLDVNAEFTRQTGIQVNYTTFASNEELYAKLAGGGASYDVIIPSDYMVSKLIHEDMLTPLDFTNIPNFQYIDESYRNPAYDPQNTYSVPYTWGLVGIFYNKNYVTEEEASSWSVLWNPKYQGKILMFDNPRDAFGIAQKLLGYSFNSTNPEEWMAAAEKLKADRAKAAKMEKKAEDAKADKAEDAKTEN